MCSHVFFIQNTQVTDAWNKIAHSFHCTPIEGKDGEQPIGGSDVLAAHQTLLKFWEAFNDYDSWTRHL